MSDISNKSRNVTTSLHFNQFLRINTTCTEGNDVIFYSVWFGHVRWYNSTTQLVTVLKWSRIYEIFVLGFVCFVKSLTRYSLLVHYTGCHIFFKTRFYHFFYNRTRLSEWNTWIQWSINSVLALIHEEFSDNVNKRKLIENWYSGCRR